jgi:catechol 2,3-dioxygenase-like lactoylglutathione lyase family enzyme
MLRIGAVVLQVADTTRAGEFWSRALGCERGANPDFLVPPAPSHGVRLHLDESDRTHLDLWTDSPREQAAEVERLVGLGATRVEWDYPQDAHFVVLADPVGTLFCVIDTSR